MKSNNSEKAVYDVSSLGRLLKRETILVISVFLVALFFFTGLSTYEALNSRRSRKLEAENLAVLCASHIERNCNHTFQLNGIMASFVLLGEVSDENFELIASRIIHDFPAADCVQLAPNGIVSNVYPLKGNESVLGHNLFEDAKRSDEAVATRANGVITIGGPYPLLQGGEGFIGRLPVFLDDAHFEFWGFVNVVVRLEKVLETVYFSSLTNSGYDYSIYKVNDKTGERSQIFGTDYNNLHSPVAINIDMPNAHWELAVSPKDTWINVHIITVLSILSFLLIVAFTGLTLLFIKLRKSNIRLAQLASIDQLTGLYSKQTAINSLKKELDYAKRNDTQVALCFIDMNNFKAINDKYGHTIGDTALIKVANRLNESVRPEDIIARFGGDEFIIIFRGKKTGTDYSTSAERIKSVLSVPAKLSGHVTTDISASLGIAVYPNNGQSVEELISYADKAMYADKQKYKESKK